MLLILASFALSEIPAIVPQPVSITEKEGTWKLVDKMTISYDKSVSESEDVAKFASDFLGTATGFTFTITDTATKSGICFVQNTGMDEEEYRLEVDTDLVKIQASSRAGLFYGIQTLLQLLPTDIFCHEVHKTEWVAPCVKIEDTPRYHWRGLMLDTSRHFFDMKMLYKLLDCLAMHKINIFHFHINDDQGWRMEIKKYPLLVSVGSQRASSPKPWDRTHQDGNQYGPFSYTQQELKDFVAYAHKLSITVVPEIEMPGHTLAALAAYPQYSCTGGPFKPMCQWGVTSNIFCGGNDDVFDFLKDILKEVFEVFDSDYIHIGGDEAFKGEWQKCPKCQKRIKDLGLKDCNALQSWFIVQMKNWLEDQGKKVIGWDEVLDGGMDPSVTIMLWTNINKAVKAANDGHKLIVCPINTLYLPRGQTKESTDKFEYNCCYSPVSLMYKFDPAATLDYSHKNMVLGAQTCLWTEFVWGGEEDLFWKIFPRTIALAEATWTPLEQKDFDRFKAAYENYHKKRCTNYGVGCAPYFE